MTKSCTEPSKSYLLNDNTSFSREKERLRKQAEQLAQLEREALIQAGLTTPHRVLELGCGNGQYLLQWQKSFPNAKFAGVDRNDKLLELAREELPSAQFFHHDLLSFSDLITTLEAFKPDTVILRFVLQHLSPNEYRQLLRTLSQSSEKLGFQLLLVDPDDTTITYEPECFELGQAIAGVIKKQASNGGDRTLGTRLNTLCQEANFGKVRSGTANAGSKSIGWDGIRSIFLPLWKQGLRTPADLARIESWINNAESDKQSAYINYFIYVTIAKH